MQKLELQIQGLIQDKNEISIEKEEVESRIAKVEAAIKAKDEEMARMVMKKE